MRPQIPGGKHCVQGLCTVCGLSHLLEDRLAWLRRALPLTAEQIRMRRPCLYEGDKNSSAAKLLARDLRAVGATNGTGEERGVYDIRGGRPCP